MIDGFNPDDSEKVLYTLASMIGPIMPQSGVRKGQFFDITDIKPRKNGEAESSMDAGAFRTHSEKAWDENSPDVIATFCVDPGEGGGEFFVVNALEEFNRLSNHEQNVLKTHDVFFPPPGFNKRNGYNGYAGRVLEKTKDGGVRIRFNAKSMDAAAPESDLGNALHSLYELFEENKKEITGQPGMLVAVNNNIMVHGRNAIKGGVNSCRIWKRMWFTNAQKYDNAM